MTLSTIIGVFLIIALVGLTVYAHLRKGEADRRFAALEEEMENQRARHQAESEALRKEMATLEKFKHIPGILEKARKTKEHYEANLVQAEARAAEIVRVASEQAESMKSEAGRECERMKASADEIIRSAEKQSTDILAKARADSKDKGQKAEEALNSATVYAAELVQKAEKKASEIGGRAYEALQKSDYYTRTATAMRNAVEGYGDRYMKPSETFLNEWAQEYGFHKAGERLRLAQERVRVMEKNHTAATCDYAETNRRQLAINFVLDAFNGKVDSILTRIKPGNYGTLAQEIKDAFALVNFSGSAFRDARITDAFLDARLEELKAAQAVQALRLKDREEQQAIKERIREEEKAQREFERSIRQAQRDEDLIKTAMDKVRRECEAAGIHERAKYESRLVELNAKLKEAEEKNLRALSMAQQTRCGHVYVISNVGSFGEDVYKIGLTRRLEPLDRVRELGDASVPFAFDVHTLIYSEDAPALETALHKRFVQMQVNKSNRRKEFFRVGLSDIRKVVEEMRLEVNWTLTAEAREYRETLAIEQKLKEDAEFRERWVQQQMVYDPLASLDEEESAVPQEVDPAPVPQEIDQVAGKDVTLEPLPSA